ncbi:4-(cytidine 5'-diphospho)-2-C-methyl-D-erythritol kinase [Rhizobium lentis]|uniref:4-diphosphocytidyl-2-C-methyl-D-erythritol kinase n=1 Tax=Rhizobium lentis TaxID=1138194 RepID=A0A9Q3MDA0_9HYPH|nr:4-(cytidine 5'-diphospho)-2-C-methyl-D-erythritol kinase [Rhizobium lentis]MBX4954644.1 4-(cytidine 5'-diphospho)-2-C-methyl-D-erythritol kinase [Rhizobium lentis]MBX4976618.1 4-(cytidine 5'-diphospho)-2-C-methyl-D-erythritol kinase [Rhizobium lentis]MBX4985821.1 4-(cytidine 5'-diphospho)-2-C-methyl-D-erythritol kinase [Rhizobium lentis]MBX4997975.1 4-(cytidine 5'-diphospho)-2-C-methyl-D-erythritol kinase [Rhizobium lentis]MBX5004265.1 4-(cytidine 5'-diphospho)-2-C-methyl-D-erythritol kinas
MPEEGLADAFGVTEEARAKINLALHVTGQRADGYHLLDMLVTFADCGDRLGFLPAQADVFTLSGRFGETLAGDGGTNLVLRARDLLREVVGGLAFPVHIHLEKNLPIASGIGGGSADAAATLRGLMRLWGMSLPVEALASLALKLGADVPMCLESRPLIARGIGEQIEALRDLPAFAMVLANPLKGVSTPEVFRRLKAKDNPALSLAPNLHGRGAWLAAIAAARNDLEPPARDAVPEIAATAAMLLAQGALLARMSGSGATCFGIFADTAAAQQAAAALHEARPDWYFQATETISGGM